MISKIGKGGGKVGGPSRRVHPGMVFARKCGKRRADAECLRKRQTGFHRPRLLRKRRGRCGLRRQASSCPEPECGRGAALHLSPACLTRGAGGAPERLAARRGTCSSHARQSFPRRVLPRSAGRASIAPAGRVNIADAQAFALARAHVVPRGLPGEAIPFASGCIGQRPALPCRERRSANRSCGAVRQTQGRERRALLSVRTCAASMLDHEKRGRIGRTPPLSS